MKPLSWIILVRPLCILYILKKKHQIECQCRYYTNIVYVSLATTYDFYNYDK